MEVSKIQLSKAETELMQNAEIILTKNRVLNKMKGLLEEVQLKQMQYQKEHLPLHDAFTVSPKISRGENYLGLPWLILDYPRKSAGRDLFFIRSMFWWGQNFSSTLHVSGLYKDRFTGPVKKALADLQSHFIGINNDPWIHHFQPDNYQPIGLMSEEAFEENNRMMEHLKIGNFFPLEDWEDASRKLFENWKFYLRITGLVTDTM